MLALLKYFLMTVWLTLSMSLGIGKLNLLYTIDNNTGRLMSLGLGYKHKKQRKNIDQWGKRYFKHKP